MSNLLYYDSQTNEMSCDALSYDERRCITSRNVGEEHDGIEGCYITLGTVVYVKCLGGIVVLEEHA